MGTTAEQFSEHEVNSLARYILYLRSNGNIGGLGLGRVGPVSEGFVAWVVGLGLLLIVIRLSEFRYADATAIAVVMLVAAFIIIFAVNRIQRWAQTRIPAH